MSFRVLESMDEADEDEKVIAAIRSPTDDVCGFLAYTASAGGEEVVDAGDICEGGRFDVLPDVALDTASHLHVSGMSGSGKSYWINQYAKNFKELTEGVVYLVSKLPPEASNLENVDKHVTPTVEIGETKPEEFAPHGNTLVVIDDVANLDKNEKIALRKFEVGIKEQGRHHGISTCSAYHAPANGPQTKASLGEATGHVVFPATLEHNSIGYLDRYLGLAPEVTSLIRSRLDLWGRFLFIKPGAYLLSEKRAVIFDPLKFKAVARAERKRLETDARAQLDRAARAPYLPVVDENLLY